MNILHMVSGLDQKSGGPTRSITGLSRALTLSGVETVLFIHSPEHDLVDGCGVRFVNGHGTGLRIIRREANDAIDDISPDIIHLHGLWMPSNHVAVLHARHRNIPVFLSTRGMLDPWALRQKALKKKLAMWLYQRRDVRSVTCFHATAKQEAANIRASGFSQPIAIIPNGVDMPEIMPMRERRSDGKRVVLFLSRLHRGKGLLELVEAWALLKNANGIQLAAKSSGEWPAARASPMSADSHSPLSLTWHVEYAGPDYGGHLADVQRRMRELEVTDDFTYLGSLDDTAKWTAYRRADLFVLPTYSENFGIAIAEALTAGVPVITTKGTPWCDLMGWDSGSSRSSSGTAGRSGGEEGTEVEGTDESPISDLGPRTHNLRYLASCRCGWWIDIGAKPLVDAVREAMNLTDEERRLMGENGRKLVEARYTWPAIATDMKAAYEWVLHGGERPRCVNAI